MDEKLNILRVEESERILLRIEGRIDGYWSGILDEYLDSLLKAGDYKVGLDLTRVHYMSSMGIRILLKFTKLFKQIGGGFGITKSSEAVDDLLEMAGLKTMLAWHSPHPSTLAGVAGETTEAAGFTFSGALRAVQQPMTCRVTGDPRKLRAGGYSGSDCHHEKFGVNRYGIGLGAIGRDFEDCKSRFGEFIGLGDAVVYSPAGIPASPDFMVKTGTLIPDIELLYGILFEGEFDKTVRFNPRQAGDTINFSRLVTELFRITGYEQFAMVMVAETAGLVGLSINNTPMADDGNGQNPFTFPEVRNRVNFTSIPEFREMMTVTAGIATRSNNEDLVEFTRPLAPGSPIRQHFHTAAFSWHPFKKDNINLEETLASLFEQERILGVLHLINDNRELTGAGESDFKSGVCWIGLIHS